MPLILSGSVNISGSMTATTILVSSPGGGGMVSSSQQIQNYNLFAVTSSANTFYGTQTISGNITSQLSNTDVTFGDVPNAQLINTATATTNQYAGIRYRFQDGSLNGNSFIGALRDSSTSRAHSIIIAPSDAGGGNPTQAIKINTTTTEITGSLRKTGTGTTAYSYFGGNAGSGGSTTPTYTEGMALSWNNSNGSGESRLTFSDSGGGNNVRFGIWYNDNNVYRETFRIFANETQVSGSFVVGYTPSNNGGARQLSVLGSNSNSAQPAATINLSQVWNAVSYPVVLEAQQGTIFGNAASDFVLKTSYFSGGVNTIQRVRITDSGIAQITGSFAVSGNSLLTGTLRTTSTNTFNGGTTYLGTTTFFRDDVSGPQNYGGSTIRVAGGTGTSAAGIQFGDVGTNATGARGRIGFLASANNGNPKEFAIIKGVLDSTGANTCNGSLTFHTLNGDNASEAGVKMTVDGNGSIGAPSGTNIYNASDIRLKQNISSISGSLSSVLALNPVKFNWVDDFVPSENGKDMLGFVAQEIQTIIPEAVESFGANSIFVGETEIDNPLRVNEKFLIPVLTKAIQEQQAIIDSLIARIEALENN